MKHQKCICIKYFFERLSNKVSFTCRIRNVCIVYLENGSRLFPTYPYSSWREYISPLPKIFTYIFIMASSTRNNYVVYGKIGVENVFVCKQPLNGWWSQFHSSSKSWHTGARLGYLYIWDCNFKLFCVCWFLLQQNYLRERDFRM